MSSGNGEADFTLADLLGRLTVKQFLGVAVALVTLIGGSIGVGAWVQSARDDAEKSRVISGLDGRINTINGQLEEAHRNFDGATDAIKSLALERHALEGKTEFLERFLRYKIAASDQSKKLFVDHVCVLWKDSEEYRVHISNTIEITDDQIRSGGLSNLSPYIRMLLIRQGVPEQFFKPGKIDPRVFRLMKAADPIAAIQKQVQAIPMVKTIQFYDGTSYYVPQEIVAVVRSRPDCAPN
jgi:hypothetical protein